MTHDGDSQEMAKQEGFDLARLPGLAKPPLHRAIGFSPPQKTATRCRTQNIAMLSMA
jgi:hypothetical protein